MVSQTTITVKRSQKNKVFDFLDRFGSISVLDAFECYAITRLSAVIYLLRREGLVIDTVIEKGYNRFGERTRFARYYLRRE